MGRMRLFPDLDGDLVEEGDRWKKALLVRTITEQCWATAKKGSNK